MMRKLAAFALILALVLSLGPADAKTKPKEEVSTYLTGPVHTAQFVAPPLYPEAQISGALTLADCYRMSLIQSEVIAINADLIRETDAHFLQALSIILPHASFESADFQQADNTVGVTGSSGASSTTANLKTSTRNFKVTQTLFNGFKAIAGIRGSKYEKNQRTDEKIRAEQLLLVDVANSFYLLLEERSDLKVLQRIRKALNDRIKELISRERLGKSRPSEIVYVKTQLYSVEASIELVKNQEILARQLLEFLVGQPVGEITDIYQFPDKLQDEKYYVAQSLERPDVEAAKFAWQLARENILAVESGFLPKVDVTGNYYTQRTSLSKGTDWDVTLNISVPIFEGTETLGASNLARLKADKDMQTYHRARRQAPYDIKTAYVSLTTAMVVRDALRKSYTTAKANAHMQIKDYDRRLVSNLDVLTAIQALEDSERNYIHALYEAKRQYWRLRVAVGQSGTESLSDTF